MGVLTIKEELIGLIKIPLIIFAFFSGGVGAIAIIKLLAVIFNTVSNHGIANGLQLLAENVISLLILFSIGIIGLAIYHIIMGVLKRISIPHANKNLEQSISYGSYGKWIKIAIVPKK